MAIRDLLTRAFGAKASIIPLLPEELPGRPLEQSFEAEALLSTYRDDAWPYVLATLKARQATQAPLVIGRETKGENGEVEFKPSGPDHPVQRLFDDPNPTMTGAEFVFNLLLYLDLVGHGPIEVVRPQGQDETGRIGALGRAGQRAKDGFELWPVSPNGWKVVPSADGTVQGYLFEKGRLRLAWTPQRMTYLRWPNPMDRYYGQSRIAAARQSVMAEEYAAIRDKKLEKQLGIPPGILTSENPIGETQAEELRRRWEKSVGGYNNAGRIAVLGSKTTYESVQLTARDSEWLATRQWRLHELSAGFGVPMVLVLGMKDATFANGAEARAELWEGTLVPDLNLVARMVTSRLLPLLTTEPLVARFDYSKVEALGENEVEQAERAKTWADTGAVSVDEVRAILKLPPHKDAKLGAAMLGSNTRTVTEVSALLEQQALAVEAARSEIESRNAEAETTRKPPKDPNRNPPQKDDDGPNTLGKGDRRRDGAAARDERGIAEGAARSGDGGDREGVLSPIRTSYERDLSSYFRAQRAALGKVVGATGLSDASRGELKADPIEELEERLIGILTAKRFRDRLRRISQGPIESSLTLGATEAARTLGIGVSFSIPTSEAALARVTSHLERLGKGIENTTIEDVRRVVRRALTEGGSNADFRAALDDLFGGYEDWRLDRISRTETTAAFNLGALGQYKDAGVGLVRVSDGDMDAPCAAANGAEWTLEMAEADPIAHPNCTRVWIPITGGL